MTTKNYQITWSPQANNDLQNIHFYIKYYLKETNIADNLIKKLLNSILDLSYFPEKYKRIIYPHNETRNIRKMSVNNYIVIYEVNKTLGQIFILHIFSSSQNYLNKLY